jgi:hypothetical protein
MPGIISRLLDRMSPEHQEDGELRDDARSAGCPPICDQQQRDVVSVHGVLRSVTLQPTSDGVCSLEAELYDGSGSVTLVWLGRRRIEGLTSGKRITACGRLGDRKGERVIFNPRYELDA